MRINEMIERLTALRDELGDVEVLVTDGFDARCYSGSYDIVEWKGIVDIGIGGCMEE